MAFEVYKRGQGKYTRLVTFAVGGVIGAAVAYYVSDLLSGTDLSQYLVFGIPLAIFAAIAMLMFWVVNRPRSADFMIATEGEMKKVSWSTKKELINSTWIVILSVAALTLFIGTIDFIISQIMDLVLR